MAIDYNASANLMVNATFQGRCRIACLHYADYIKGEDPAVPAHTSRLRWAQEAVRDPFAAVNQIMTTLIMDPKVQDSGDAITDIDLQSSVETSVNKLI